MSNDMESVPDAKICDVVNAVVKVKSRDRTKAI